MNTSKNFSVLAALAGAIALAACGSSTESGDPASPNGSSRFGVSDSLIGRWKGIAGTSGELDTIQITMDSMSGVWTTGTSTSAWPTTLRPYSDAKFYAHHGRMGMTNGMTVIDNVSFEYMFRGETLYVELQNLARAPVDGKIDTDSTWFTHAWLKHPLMTTNRPISMN
jgi:hypothetical protein